MSREDTAIDVPALRAPALVRTSSKTAAPAPKARTAREATGPVVGAAAWDGNKARSLLDVQLRESAGRRGASSVTRRLTSEPKGRPVLVRIDFVRSLDRDVRMVTVGADSVVVEGTASGCTTDGRRPATIAVGVEGRLYSVALEGGETAADCTSRLARRLSSDFVVECEGTTLRIVRER